MRFTLFIFILLILSGKASADNVSWHIKDSVLYINENVRKIPEYAFADNKGIREVRFGTLSKLEEIGEYAFLGCSNLHSLALPEGVITIGEGCFRECSDMISLTLPESITAYPKSMCMWDINLRCIEVSGNLEDIGSHCFAYCKSMERIEIPEGVRHIGSNAFSMCESLRSIFLPTTVEELESYAFSECISLENAELPANNKLLGELIFSGCINLRSLTIKSDTPPEFDCNSFIFEPDETNLYEQCHLFVPKNSIKRYRHAHGWNLFQSISGANNQNQGLGS